MYLCIKKKKAISKKLIILQEEDRLSLSYKRLRCLLGNDAEDFIRYLDKIDLSSQLSELFSSAIEVIINASRNVGSHTEGRRRDVAYVTVLREDVESTGWCIVSVGR